MGRRTKRNMFPLRQGALGTRVKCLESLTFNRNNSHKLCKHSKTLKHRRKFLAIFAYEYMATSIFFSFLRHQVLSSADLSALPARVSACPVSLLRLPCPTLSWYWMGKGFLGFEGVDVSSYCLGSPLEQNGPNT